MREECRRCRKRRRTLRPLSSILEIEGGRIPGGGSEGGEHGMRLPIDKVRIW